MLLLPQKKKRQKNTLKIEKMINFFRQIFSLKKLKYRAFSHVFRCLFLNHVLKIRNKNSFYYFIEARVFGKLSLKIKDKKLICISCFKNNFYVLIL